MKNRKVEDLTFIYGKAPVLEWNDAEPGEVFLEISYTNNDGEPRKYRIPGNENVGTIPDFQEGSSITYKSLYLPEIACIDTFVTSETTVPAPTYYSSVSIKNVVEKSGLVKEIISQFVSDIHEDLEYSTLQFKKENNEPLSIFVLKANLANKRLSISTLMPNNGTEFGRQTVKEMVEHRNNAGGKVLAATNADFFDLNDGTPWGPVVINGEILKDVQLNSGTTYFGIAKGGDPTVGYYSSDVDLTTFKEVVGGGGHWIVTEGKNGSWSGDTKEPRTSVGYTSQGTVYLVVVDGRNTSYSVGAELTDLALIMKSLGNYQAINLDGGGSSTMVVKKDNIFEIVNKYSDSSPRAVANSLSIVIN